MSGDDSFRIELGPDGILTMAGRFDASQVPKADAVLDVIAESVTADLADLAYISSAGIGSILKAFKRLQDEGHVLKLKNLSPTVRNVFYFSGLDQVLVIE